MIKDLLGLLKISPTQKANRNFWRHTLLALTLVVTTLATASHIHADSISSSTDLAYEDCGAFHHSSADHAATPSLDLHFEFLSITESIISVQQIASDSKTLRPPPRAPPIFS